MGISDWLGGLLGGAAGAASASANNANAGHENMTTTTNTQTNPWGPASPYLQYIMQQAVGDLGPGSAAWGNTTPTGQGNAAPNYPGPGTPGMYGNPAAPTTPTGGQPGGGGGGIHPGYYQGPNPGGGVDFADSKSAAAGQNQAGGYTTNGMPSPGGGGGLPTGGAAGGTVGLTGVSATDQQAIDAMMGMAGNVSSNPLYKAASGYEQGLLKGQNVNPYLSQTYGQDQSTYGNLQGLAASGNPQVQQYINMLFGGQMPGSPGATSSSGPQLSGGGGMSFNITGANAPPPVAGEAAFIQQQLTNNPYQQNPAMQQMVNAATSQIKNQMAQQTLPGVTSKAIGGGLMGGSAWQNAMAQAANQETQQVGNAVAPLYYQGYADQQARQMQAAQIGEQYNAAQIQANTQLAGSAMQASAAGGAAGLQAQVAMAQLAQQKQLAMMQALQGGLGMQAGIEQNAYGDMGTLSGQMGGLSTAYGQQQGQAAGLAPGLVGLPAGIMGEAGNLSLGASRNAVSAQQAQDQLRASLAAASNQRSAINLQRQEFYDPLTRLGDVSGIIGGLTGRYGSTSGTQNVQGTNFTGLQPQSVAGQGLAGALGGMNLANMLGGGGGGGGLGNLFGGGGADPSISSTNPGGNTMPPGTFYDPNTGQYYQGDPNQYAPSPGDPNYVGPPSPGDPNYMDPNGP